jgi:hypothetical protein
MFAKEKERPLSAHFDYSRNYKITNKGSRKVDGQTLSLSPANIHP